MSNKMLRFVDLAKAMPEKRQAEARRRDFDEIYQEFDPAAAAGQASRCSQCGVPFCQVHCPLHNNIPDWLKLTAEGRLEEAYELAQATNNFPEICGRICPQDRLCEGNCVIEQSGHGTVTIGTVERYITETAWDRGWVKPVRPRRELEASVGIVGAGPAGLAAAEELCSTSSTRKIEWCLLRLLRFHDTPAPGRPYLLRFVARIADAATLLSGAVIRAWAITTIRMRPIESLTSFQIWASNR